MNRQIEDILVQRKDDRRILPNVPNSAGTRFVNDRRRSEAKRCYFKDINNPGDRYVLNCDVDVKIYKRGSCKSIKLRSKDISATGMLLECHREYFFSLIKFADYFRLEFTPTPGALPEGFEHRIKVKAKLAREEGNTGFAVEFKEPLTQKLNKSHGRQVTIVSLVSIICIFIVIMLMHAGSILYFRFNFLMYLYSIITAIFLLSRFIIAAFTRPVPVDPEYTPSVSVIIPCFNEETWINRTILSCMNQEYPADKLEVIVVDDCSTDNSAEAIHKTIKLLKTCPGAPERIRFIRQPKNAGKREALTAGAEAAKNTLLIFVDSDSFLEPTAVMKLVQPFKDPKVGGVAGRTNVANAYTNWLTKLQAARYYISFRVMKAAESYFDTVSCLSGPLSCYRRQVVLDNKDVWLNQTFLGVKATFGDDRALTNFVLRKYRTCYQDNAICSTIVPNNHKTFLRQQMRWKRSWLRESINALGYIWKKEPFAVLFFLMGLIIPVFAPIIVIYNLIYTPIKYGVTPVTFITGLALMSMLFSFAHLFLKKSRLWAAGFLFCLYYESILLWQMPLAWITFWKSTWGTRLTPQDLKDLERKHWWKLFMRKEANVEREDKIHETIY